MDPGAFVVFSGAFDDDAFPVFTPLIVAEVMRSAQGIHERGTAEGRRFWEERFAEVLGRLDVLEILDEELGGGHVLHHFHL